jgi:hypothetical protein
VRIGLLITVLLAGCEGCGGDTSQATGATPATQSSSGSTEAVAGGEGAGEGAPAVPEHVAVRAEADRYGRVTIAVENRGDEVARLAPRLTAGDATLSLRVDCETEPPSCIELAPGAVLYPCDCASCENISATAQFELVGCVLH